MSQSLNFSSLEDFISREVDDISTIHLWYEKLSEYELDGSETPKEVDTLVNAMRYLMNFSFTAAEELKEVAEREAVEMAEKEEEWEEQKQALKDELASVRDRLTISADAGESSEAFRSQIDSLKEENRQLQQMSRDRDREMADQRDRFENLVSRADALTRERDSLSDHRNQLEDTIRELNRRISSKNEDASNEWGARKLLLRNEQAVTLSKQMQVVVAQNEHLRSEVERVSTALEDATRLIESSTKRVSDLSDDLKTTQQRASELWKENVELQKKLNEKTELVREFEASAMDASTILQKKIEGQEAQIDHLTQQLRKAETEVMELRDRIGNDSTKEREEELEKLKQELVSATKVARSFFGQKSVSKEPQDNSHEVRIRIVQLENSVEDARRKIDEYKKSEQELEEIIVQKDISHSEIATELERLRELKFGDVRQEISRLETQLKLRDEQIARLSNQCTLLQVELGSYADGRKTSNTLARSESKTSHHSQENDEALSEDDIVESTPRTPSEPYSADEKEVEQSEEKVPPTATVEEKIPARRRVTSRVGPAEVEQQAMIIAGLNHEVMACLEELELKNKQLLEMEHVVLHSKRTIEENKRQLKLAYDEIVSLKKANEKEEDSELEEKRAEVVELRRLVETVRIGGSELERRAEETTRKLIGERISRIRLHRMVSSLQRRCHRAEETSQRIKKRMTETCTDAHKQNARLQYELDICHYDMALVQTKLINSVPLKQFEDLSRKYRQEMKRDLTGDHVIEEPTSVIVDLSAASVETGNEELQASNTYLKKIVSVLSDQNEFWSQETEILQKENRELKTFVENLENESDLKEVLGAIEHRLLETIREQAESVREHTREHRKKRDAAELLAKQRVTWREERKRLVQIITMLQRTVVSQRGNAVGSLTLPQMESLKSKILETQENADQAKTMRKQAEEIREHLESQLRNMRDTKKARETLDMEGPERQRVERALQMAYNTAGTQTARAQRLEGSLEQQKSVISQLESELEDLREKNEEYLTVLCNMRVGGPHVPMSNLKTNEQEKKEEYQQKTEEKGNELTEETDYEMDFNSGSSETSSRSENEPRRIIMDNSKEWMEQMKHIRNTTEVCIQAYKDQLTQKELAIENYRELLLARMDEPIVRAESETYNRSWRDNEAEETTEMQTEQKLIEAVGEIARLHDEVSDLEAANRDLFRLKASKQEIATYSIGVQTEGMTEAELSGRSRSSAAPAEDKTDIEQLNDFVIEVEKRDESQKYKNEIRTLQSRIRQLNTRNKELLAACEKIKEDALEELSAGRNEYTTQDESLIATLRDETRQLQRAIRVLKKKNEEQNSIITNLSSRAELSRKDTEEEVSKWKERKHTEVVIAKLREKLGEFEKRDKNMKDRLARYEKRMEDFGKENEIRGREVERLKRKMKDAQNQRDAALRETERNSIFKEKMNVLEDRIREKEKETLRLPSRVRKTGEEKQELLLKLQESTRPRTSVVANSGGDKRSTATQTQTQRTNTVKASSSQRTETESETKTEQQLKEQRKEARMWELRFQESTEKAERLEKQNKVLSENYSSLTKKNTERDDRSGGAVALLADKLEAKDKEINRLKSRISSLERKLSQ